METTETMLIIFVIILIAVFGACIFYAIQSNKEKAKIVQEINSKDDTEEIDEITYNPSQNELLQKLSNIEQNVNTIKNCMVFFVILTAISIIISIFLACSVASFINEITSPF